jgi:hypothetical protein
VTLGSPRLRLLVLFALLAVIHTWPLAAHPGYWSRLDSADASLNTWAIAWVAHTLPFHPTHLFDANIFHPAPLTFAYSEPVIVQGLLALPILALGGSPVLAYNLVALVGFTLTAWATALLILRATDDGWAALIAGSLAAFNAHTLTRLPHLQALHLEFLPLAIVALDRLALSARIGDAVLLAAAVGLQAMASIYALVFTAWTLAWAAVARGWTEGTPRWRTLCLLALAAVLAAGLLAPILYPYYLLSHETGLVRSASESRLFSSTWTDYLYTGARLHFALWSQRFGSSADANFPGLTATLLALVALSGLRRDRLVRMAAAILASAVVLSVAPRLPGFDWAHDHLPIVSAIRGYSRAGQFALVAIAILAGLGVARLHRAWGARRGWTLAAAALAVLVNVEALRAPLLYVPFRGVPAIYDSLAEAPAGAVLELPIYGPGAEFMNAPYLVNATRHWRPIVNGYSGFMPPGYMDIYRGLRRFPDAWSIGWLRANGVNRIVVHLTAFEQLKGRLQLKKIEASPDVTLVASDSDTRIYSVRPQSAEAAEGATETQRNQR